MLPLIKSPLGAHLKHPTEPRGRNVVPAALVPLDAFGAGWWAEVERAG